MELEPDMVARIRRARIAKRSLQKRASLMRRIFLTVTGIFLIAVVTALVSARLREDACWVIVITAIGYVSLHLRFQNEIRRRKEAPEKPSDKGN
ncbi:hypothetical protein D2T29_12490 [Sinirhodobacter populi]|uniref:Uncharacterized protein n=1 Tax=Paenirhodobacter populi TaxID=2306993 RepID=A0A443KD07_9RHOB|nr:hypothetical protein [Sinirhodobacter populi]RWR30483.1 hypothetical protein D2T29_12490 [Sinirhodobacter populi]